jgi:hypothetical protein
MIRREDDGIWSRERAYCDREARKVRRILTIQDRALSVYRVRAIAIERAGERARSRRCLMPATGRGGLEPPSRHPDSISLELGFQALPLIRVHRLEIGVRELAVRSRLSRQQRRVGPANAQFGRLLCFRVSPPARRHANGGCPDLPISPFEIAANGTEVTTSRIARASG